MINQNYSKCHYLEPYGCLMTCFLYCHFHAFWEMSLKIIKQKFWWFEHSLIDSLFILNGLIDDLELVYKICQVKDIQILQ